MKELYEHLPSVEKFLERIGLPGFKPEVNLETIDTLVEAFLTHIPYENLEVSYEHKIPSLAPVDLYDKLVTRKRGGYCFEMNGAMWALLRDIGFEVYSVVAYIRENRWELHVPTHRGNIVVIEGEKYYVDVGFGSRPILTAVPFKGRRNGYYFHVNEIGEYTLCRVADVELERRLGFEEFILKDEDGTLYKKVLMFRDYRAYPQEFFITNEWSAKSNHPMAVNWVCNLKNPDGELYRIFGNSFKWENAEGIGERLIEDDEDFRKIIKDYFGIVL